MSPTSVIPQKSDFLKELEKQTPGWNLAYVNRDWRDEKSVFALAPTIEGPLLIGDEMGINDPIIPLEDHQNTFYGFTFGAETKNLPDNRRELAKIWRLAIATYKFAQGKSFYISCPVCKSRSGNSSRGQTIRGHFCRKCFGMGSIYTFGPQKKLGRILLRESSAKLVNHSTMVKFLPAGLSALLKLYDTYHTGFVSEIAQHYLISNSFSVIKKTFPNFNVYFTYDDQREPGMCDFVQDIRHKIWYRRFYLLLDEKYINLYTGEEVDEIWATSLMPIRNSLDLPNRDRWNVTLDIMRNLCKYATKQ